MNGRSGDFDELAGAVDNFGLAGIKGDARPQAGGILNCGALSQMISYSVEGWTWAQVA